MNKRHPIDELFREQLGQSSAGLPDDMWDRIAAERGQQSRKPKMLWMWGVFSVLVLAAGLFLAGQLLFEAPPLPMNVVPLVEPEEQASYPLLQTQKHQLATFSGNEIIEKATYSAPSLLPAVSKTSHWLNTLSDNAHTLKTNKPDRSTKLRSHSISPDRNIAIEKRKKIAKQLTSERSAEVNQQPAVAHKLQQEVLGEDENKISGPHQRLHQYTVKNIPILAFDPSRQEDVRLFEKSATSCARFNNPFLHFDLEILSGPAYAQQILTTRTSESNAHLEQRLNSESAALSYSAGVRLAATTQVGLGLKAGLMYSQINDVFRYEVGSSIRIDIRYDTNGQPVSMDTTYIAAYTEKYQNRLRFVEVPLLVSYETKWGKFRVGVNAGAYLQLAFDAKGQIFSPATREPIAFGQIGDSNVLPIFNKRASAAWYAGLSIAYNLRSRYSIIAEPYFKTFPRALSTPEYDLKQNYRTVGLQLGLRMRI